MMAAPLAIDLFCGLGGWTEGLIAEGYFVIGFDIEQHIYGDERYPAHLVLQDILTIHGSQFKDAALIVASPPCQEFSYMAMPWSRAKAKAAAIRADETGKLLADLTKLFDACFRIQHEAIKAAGHHIPMVVENVRGAQPWVGRARWSWGSYFLWGDVPALMPPIVKATKVPGFRFDGSGRSFQTAAVNEHVEVKGMNWSNFGKPDYKAVAFNDEAIRKTRSERHSAEGIKQGGTWFHDNTSASRTSSLKSPARKAASAQIAKIPFELSRHIARSFKPQAALGAA